MGVEVEGSHLRERLVGFQSRSPSPSRDLIIISLSPSEVDLPSKDIEGL